MMRHPARHELFAYAESLVDAEAAVSAKVAGHMGGGGDPPPWTAAARGAWVRRGVPRPGGRTHPAVATAPPAGRRRPLPSAPARNESSTGC